LLGFFAFPFSFSGYLELIYGAALLVCKVTKKWETPEEVNFIIMQR
jgi:hypothetical protein